MVPVWVKSSSTKLSFSLQIPLVSPPWQQSPSSCLKWIEHLIFLIKDAQLKICWNSSVGSKRHLGSLEAVSAPFVPPSPSPPLRWQNSSQEPVPPIHNPTPMVLYHMSTNKSPWETLEQPFVAKAHRSLLFTESTHFKCTQFWPSTRGPQVPEKGSLMASETKRPSK